MEFGEQHVFVTVGTTQFDMLIKTVTSDEILDRLVNMGCKKIILQTGRGEYQVKVSRNDIDVQSYDFKNSIAKDIDNASLVISHAGAGSILETLRKEKPLLVVINESLMDNHQYELAEKMEEEGHLYFCTCDNIKRTLETRDFSDLTKISLYNRNLLSNYLGNFLSLIDN